MISVDFLLTTVGKSTQQIIEIIDRDNIRGNIIVGNQKCEIDYIESFSYKESKIVIVNQTSIGTSKNRNAILKRAKSDFVVFWDDDCIMDESFYDFIKEHNELISLNAFRLNSYSLNDRRPIKSIDKNCQCGLYELRSFGVCGVFFNLKAIRSIDLTFDENVGPGTNINHGEDIIFLSSFLKKFKNLFQFEQKYISIMQDESCWYDSDYKKMYLAQGYIYSFIFGWKYLLFGVYNIIKHSSEYKGPFLGKMKWFLKGHKCFLSSKRAR